MFYSTMGDSKNKALKRKLSPGQVVPSKIQKKNAVCTLHEMYRGLVFKVVEVEGPVHMPIFTISVEVNGSEYKGQGKNKKIAKQAAAEAALRLILQTADCDFIPMGFGVLDRLSSWRTLQAGRVPYNVRRILRRTFVKPRLEDSNFRVGLWC